ncbi:Diguanylate cyclase VdcA [Sulfurospirillum diekertiae]|uniref:Diguanylate cyclase VdcA n=1 Tax=Sulfurospirillum diekertiae TaxID=1854492 RepID=A0A1Y0HJX2_9BACT|nr:GGDEF domain-containing protein [Sulfurospirillum diekertiae]ARU48260.1 Diguanylate cyclase VdcA [Sulfurospirillum diekertiae]
MSSLDHSLNETMDSIVSTCNLIPEVFRDGIILCDSFKESISISDKVCEFTGYSQEDFAAQSPFSLITHCEPIFQKDTVQYATSIQSKLGHSIPIIIYPKIIYRNHHTLFLFIIQKQAEFRVPLKNYFLAQFPNRFLFLHEMLRQTIRYSHQTNAYGALLLLDIDNFKAVNHVKGYSFGDQILRDIAKKISSVVNTLSVEHLNGDEFAIVYHTHACVYDKAKEEVNTLSRKILDTIKKPIVVEDQSFLLSASIGVVPFIGEEYLPDTIIQYADGALHEAKKNWS